MTEADQIRIAVALARRGVGSRRAAERLIRAGRVTLGGELVTNLALRVDPNTSGLQLDGRELAAVEPLRYFALNKPAGVVSTARDERGRRSVVDYLPATAGRCVPVGRLDLDSEGLLLLTNDGPLIADLLHPSREIQRVYLAEVVGTPSRHSLDRMVAGVLDDGEILRAKPKRSKRPGRVVGRGRRTSWLSLTLHTGRKREVRRLCEALGHPVVSLQRVRFGPILLRDLEVGQLRPLTRREIRLLRRAAGFGEEPGEANGPRPLT